MVRPRRCTRYSRRTDRSGRPPDNSSTKSWKESEMAKSSKGNGAGEGKGRDRGGFKSPRHGRAPAADRKAQKKQAAEEREKQGQQPTEREASRFLKGQRIDPRRID